MASETFSKTDDPLKSSFVIIGGGIAGVSCAEQLFVEEPGESIILISSSPLVKAARNVHKISERLEEFNVTEEPYSTLEKQNPFCRVVEASAIEIDEEKHEVYLSNGQIVQYVKLCICSGGIPNVITQGNSFVLGIRDTETVQEFQKKLSNSKKVLIVGNGGIATELVYGIENCEVVWVIKDKSIGATFFDAGAAHFFLPCLNEAKHEETVPCKRLNYELEGTSQQKSIIGSALGPDWSVNVNMKGKIQKARSILVEYECEVKNIYSKAGCNHKLIEKGSGDKVKESWPVYVELTNGSVHGCDFVISATGVIPNTSIFNNNKFLLAEDKGILIDDQMKTNLKDIFAAGDVCSASWPLAKHWFQMRLWTQARQMGAFAAKCMSCDLRGETALLDICFDLFTHITRFFGYKVVLLGLYNGQKLGKDYEIIVRSSERTEYVKIILQEGKMQGAVLIGETDLEETFENLILNQLDISVYGEDILNPDIDIEDYFD